MCDAIPYCQTYRHWKKLWRTRDLEIQKALNQIAGPVKSAFRLRDGSFVVEMRTDDQSRKLQKQELLGSYPVLRSTKFSAQSGVWSSASRQTDAVRKTSLLVLQISMCKNIPCTQETGGEVSFNAKCILNIRNPNHAGLGQGMKQTISNESVRAETIEV
jgi:hypothetical protein